MKPIITYKYHYVYRITNTVTEMYYYGDRSCNCYPSEDIGFKYFSTFSNKFFKIDQQNNPQDYKYKIIKIFETCRKDAKQLEVDLHKKFDVKNHPKFINRANQTSSKFDSSHMVGPKNHFYGKTHSSKTKDMLSQQRKGKNLGKENHFYGKKHSNKTLDKLSKLQMNKVSVQDKNGKRFTVDKNDKRILCGELITINKLNSQSKEVRIKMSKNHADVSGANNPRAKKVEIYDSNDNLIYECYGDMKELCVKNNLPYNQLLVTKNKTLSVAFESMTPQTKSKHINNGYYPKFKGWYAKLVG